MQREAPANTPGVEVIIALKYEEGDRILLQVLREDEAAYAGANDQDRRGGRHGRGCKTGVGNGRESIGGIPRRLSATQGIIYAFMGAGGILAYERFYKWGGGVQKLLLPAVSYVTSAPLVFCLSENTYEAATVYLSLFLHRNSG